MRPKEIPPGIPKIDGWFDLTPEGLIDAVSHLTRENLRVTNEHMIKSRVISFRDSKLIPEEVAEELLSKLDSLAERPHGR